MRTKGGLEKEFVKSGDWKDKGFRGNPMSTLEIRRVNGERKVVIHSFSGNERNKLFINESGKAFADVSTYSGVDSVSDSRCFALWDYDHDGATDIALVNSNAPHLQIYKNQMTTGTNQKQQFVVVKLLGGNQEPKTSDQWSNRDGVGARIRIQTEESEFVRELRRGEGFSVQNSSNLVIGIGDATQVKKLTIEWPSGKTQTIENVDAGSLVTIYENTNEARDSNGFQISDYVAAASSNKIVKQTTRGMFNFNIPNEDKAVELRVLINMATWCEACRKEIPAVAKLMSQIDDPRVVFIGVPIDVQDSTEKLQSFAESANPPYEILQDLPGVYRRGVASYVKQQLGSDALPNTVITDSSGNPISAQFGLPTTSKILRILESSR